MRPETSNAEIISRTQEYVARLQELLGLYEHDLASASKQFQQRSDLYNGGLISRQVLEASQKNLAGAQARVNEARDQMTSAYKIIAEVRLAIELEKGQEHEKQDENAVIFYAGKSPWSLSEASRIEAFFVSRFGISLPVSAVGQTELHTRMGFNHDQGIDIALHPDSSEGQDLMEFLRSSGFSFIAFRQAIEGSSTGAHIHVGSPSAKIIAAGKTVAIQKIKAGS